MHISTGQSRCFGGRYGAGRIECTRSAVPEKTDKSHRKRIQAGSRNSIKIRKLDDQTVLESGDTKAVSHWSDLMGKREEGKGKEEEKSECRRNGTGSRITTNKDNLLRFRETIIRLRWVRAKTSAQPIGRVQPEKAM